MKIGKCLKVYFTAIDTLLIYLFNWTQKSIFIVNTVKNYVLLCIIIYVLLFYNCFIYMPNFNFVTGGNGVFAYSKKGAWGDIFPQNCSSIKSKCKATETAIKNYRHLFIRIYSIYKKNKQI